MIALLLRPRIAGLIFILIYCIGASCKNNSNEIKNNAIGTGQYKDTAETIQDSEADEPAIADVATILARKQVPVLCYHHIRPEQGDYSVSPANFVAQMQALKDSGYHTILPDQLYGYLAYSTPLPEKPIMITFDDTDEEQFTIGAKELEKHGFKGVFFIMTISIGKPGYMSSDEIRDLSQRGHAIESHTWDHKKVTLYTPEDIQKQLVKPRKTIEKITGNAATYFAYPFGIWDKEVIPELKDNGFKMAFILSSKRDTTNPLFTVRRMIVPGSWSTKGMMKATTRTFD